MIMTSDAHARKPPPDRPPILSFLCLFAALLGLALGLAALAPEPGPSAEELVRDLQRPHGGAGPAADAQPPMAARRTGAPLSL